MFGLRKTVFLFALGIVINVKAQERPIKIITEEIPKRIQFYAINENEQDFDVMIVISGTNFRQSKARPRFIRVPATSKVHLKTILPLRGKKPTYTYELTVNDSLSNRALKKEFENIKIEPDKRIIVYIPENCATCDSLIRPLSEGKYLFSSFKLSENPKIKEQLGRSMGKSIVLDSLETPILNLGGRLHTKIETYDQLLEALQKD